MNNIAGVDPPNPTPGLAGADFTAEQVVREVIEHEGRISFARFMEIALFAPQVGYYMRGGGVGGDGDYITSPVTHPVFGALVGLQLEQMWNILEQPNPFWVVEPGAGSGSLARDILRYVQVHLPDFARCVNYLAVDVHQPSVWNDQPLPEWAIAQTLPITGVIGCILTNELFDAFPVNRFVFQNGEVLEVYVTLRGGHLVEELDLPATTAISQRLDALGIVLPEGFQGEMNLGLDSWVSMAASSLTKGFILTIDYGARAEELYSHERTEGTLRSYYRHTLSASPYQWVGFQDLTAHVDFSRLVEYGKSLDLIPLGYTSQRQFLKNLGIDVFLKALTRRSVPSGERYASQMAMRELIRPGGMGDFKVLVQGKGVELPRIYGFSHSNSLLERLHRHVDTLDVPTPTADHARLLEAKYPHLGYNFHDKWPTE